MDVVNPKLKLRRKRKRLLLAGADAVVLVAVALGVAWMGPALPGADRSSLWIGTVKRGDMLREVRATGILALPEARRERTAWSRARAP